jgi:hypothetical protein
VQRIPEQYGCIGDYLAHDSVLGNLCSGKLSLILIGRGALKKQNVESYAQFNRREYAAHHCVTLFYSSGDGEGYIKCGLRMSSSRQ